MRASRPSIRTALVSAAVALGTAAASAGLVPATAQSAPAPPLLEPAESTVGTFGAPATAKSADAEVPTAAPTLVTLRAGTSPEVLDGLVRAVRRAGGTVAARLDQDTLGFTGRLDGAAEALVREHPAVATVEDNAMFSLAGTQGKPPWHLDRIDQVNLPLDKRYAFGGAKKHSNGKGVRIYVVDSGVRAKHRQLKGRVAKGHSVFRNAPARKDCGGHGTHVAGLAAGKKVGVAKRAIIVPVRVFKCNAKTSARNVIRGINWVTKNHKKPAVMNLSIAGPPNRAVARAIKRANKRGIHVVAAAGNEGVNACSRMPAKMKKVLTVGALTRADRPASFSNLGRCVNVWAPGQKIRSLGKRNNRALKTMSGTSMAAPLAAGTVARILQVQRKLKPAKVRRLLVAAAPTLPLTRASDGAEHVFARLYAGVRDDVHRRGVPASSLTTNPGFESGAAGWTAANGAVITSDSSVPAARGSWKGIVSGPEQQIYQPVTVPSGGRPWASYRLRVLTSRKGAAHVDRMRVGVYDATTGQFVRELGTFTNRSATGRFQRYQVNLGPYRGQTIILAFHGVGGETGRTRFVIDDVYAAAK